MLVLGALMARREPAAKLLTMALAWIAIFAAGFVLFTFRDDFGWVAQRLKAEAIGDTGAARHAKPASRWRSTAISGSTAKVNGKKVKFLVDSGATMTTIDRRDAQSQPACRCRATPISIVRTGNGIIRVSSGRAADLAGRSDRARATSAFRSPTTTISTCSG